MCRKYIKTIIQNTQKGEDISRRHLVEMFPGVFEFICTSTHVTNQIMSQFASFCVGASGASLCTHREKNQLTTPPSRTLEIFVAVNPRELAEFDACMAQSLNLDASSHLERKSNELEIDENFIFSPATTLQQCAFAFHISILNWLDTQARFLEEANIHDDTHTNVTRLLLSRNFAHYITNVIVRPSFEQTPVFLGKNQTCGSSVHPKETQWIRLVCCVEGFVLEYEEKSSKSLATTLNDGMVTNSCRTECERVFGDRFVDVSPSCVKMRILRRMRNPFCTYISDCVSESSSFVDRPTIISDWTLAFKIATDSPSNQDVLGPLASSDNRPTVLRGNALYSRYLQMGKVVVCDGFFSHATTSTEGGNEQSHFVTMHVSEPVSEEPTAASDPATVTAADLDRAFERIKRSWLHFALLVDHAKIDLTSQHLSAFKKLLSMSRSLHIFVAMQIVLKSSSQSETCALQHSEGPTNLRGISVFLAVPGARCEDILLETLRLGAISSAYEWNTSLCWHDQLFPDVTHLSSSKTKKAIALWKPTKRSLSSQEGTHFTNPPFRERITSGCLTSGPNLCAVVPDLRRVDPHIVSKCCSFLSKHIRERRKFTLPLRSHSSHPALNRPQVSCAAPLFSGPSYSNGPRCGTSEIPFPTQNSSILFLFSSSENQSLFQSIAKAPAQHASLLHKCDLALHFKEAHNTDIATDDLLLAISLFREALSLKCYQNEPKAMKSDCREPQARLLHPSAIRTLESYCSKARSLGKLAYAEEAMGTLFNLALAHNALSSDAGPHENLTLSMIDAFVAIAIFDESVASKTGSGTLRESLFDACLGGDFSFSKFYFEAILSIESK